MDDVSVRVPKARRHGSSSFTLVREAVVPGGPHKAAYSTPTVRRFGGGSGSAGR